MKKLIFVVLLTFVLGGCASTPYVSPEGCVNQPSFIQDKVKDPRALDKALLGVQFVALESLANYTYADAQKVLADIRTLVNTMDGLTYADVVAFIQSKLATANRNAGAAIFILGPNITALSIPEVITPCDKILIDIHLAHQETLIMFYAGKK